MNIDKLVEYLKLKLAPADELTAKLAELVAILRRREESLASVVLEPAELMAWKAPRYRYRVVHIRDQELQKELDRSDRDQPEWEVFSIPSETCVVYRMAIEDPEEPTESEP